MKKRPVLRVLTLLVAGLSSLLLLRSDHPIARAGEPAPTPKPGASTMSPIERIDDSTAPPKPPPGPPPAKAIAVPACALSAYAKLAEERAKLEVTHASDPIAFEGAYLAKKNSLVGQRAMDALGCKGGTP